MHNLCSILTHTLYSHQLGTRAKPKQRIGSRATSIRTPSTLWVTACVVGVGDVSVQWARKGPAWFISSAGSASAACAAALGVCLRLDKVFRRFNTALYPDSLFEPMFSGGWGEFLVTTACTRWRGAFL